MLAQASPEDSAPNRSCLPTGGAGRGRHGLAGSGSPSGAAAESAARPWPSQWQVRWRAAAVVVMSRYLRLAGTSCIAVESRWASYGSGSGAEAFTHGGSRNVSVCHSHVCERERALGWPCATSHRMPPRTCKARGRGGGVGAFACGRGLAICSCAWARALRPSHVEPQLSCLCRQICAASSAKPPGPCCCRSGRPRSSCRAYVPRPHLRPSGIAPNALRVGCGGSMRRVQHHQTANHGGTKCRGSRSSAAPHARCILVLLFLVLFQLFPASPLFLGTPFSSSSSSPPSPLSYPPASSPSASLSLPQLPLNVATPSSCTSKCVSRALSPASFLFRFLVGFLFHVLACSLASIRPFRFFAPLRCPSLSPSLVLLCNLLAETRASGGAAFCSSCQTRPARARQVLAGHRRLPADVPQHLRRFQHGPGLGRCSQRNMAGAACIGSLARDIAASVGRDNPSRLHLGEPPHCYPPMVSSPAHGAVVRRVRWRGALCHERPDRDVPFHLHRNLAAGGDSGLPQDESGPHLLACLDARLGRGVHILAACEAGVPMMLAQTSPMVFAWGLCVGACQSIGMRPLRLALPDPIPGHPLGEPIHGAMLSRG